MTHFEKLSFCSEGNFQLYITLWLLCLLYLTLPTEIPSISINFKNRCILCDVCSKQILSIIHVDTFHGSKGDFTVSCAATSFKIQNHYFVANLTDVVHLVEDCCASHMKL